MTDMIEVVAARCESVLASPWVVYRGEAPSKVPPRSATDSRPVPYVIVRASVGVTGSDVLADAAERRVASVWVTSVSEDPDPQIAASEAGWAQGRCVDALAGWRPWAGAFQLQHTGSQPPRREDDLPTSVVSAVDMFSADFQR